MSIYFLLGGHDIPRDPPMPETYTCYQCDKEVRYLFEDSCCKDCTRLTPEEVIHGIEGKDYSERGKEAGV